MGQAKSGKPSISATEAERVLDVLRRLYRDRFKENKSELARALGRSQPAVTQLLDGTNLPSLDTARRVARIEGVDVTTYLDEHAEVPSDEPFPSKHRAAQSARGLQMPDWAIQQMVTEPPPHGISSDPGPMFWFRRVEQLLTAPRVPDPGQLAAPAARSKRRTRRA